MNSLHELSDQDLLQKFLKTDKKETEITTEILFFLAEVDRRKIYLQEGYSSLFSYCTENLKYSEGAAYKRISSARLIANFPEALNYFQDKRVNLTTLSMVSKLITPQDFKEVLDGIAGKTKREVEVFIAGYRTESIRKSIPKERVKVLSVPIGAGKKKEKRTSLLGNKQQDIFKVREKDSETAPENEEGLRYELKLSVDEETLQKIEKIKSLISSKYPEGVRLEHVLIEAADIFLENKDPKRKEARRAKRKKIHREMERRTEKGSENTDKVKVVSKKKEAQNQQRKRHIPAALKDQVYLRDKGRCSYVSSDGVRCSSKHNLQVDHIIPFAKGGAHKLENLRLMCRAHNLLEAEKHFGAEYVRQKIKQAISA